MPCEGSGTGPWRWWSTMAELCRSSAAQGSALTVPIAAFWTTGGEGMTRTAGPTERTEASSNPMQGNRRNDATLQETRVDGGGGGGSVGAWGRFVGGRRRARAAAGPGASREGQGGEANRRGAEGRATS